MAVTSGQMNFHNQLQRNRIAAKFYPLIRRFQNWNRRIKTNRKIRDSRNHGKTFLNLIHPKIPMVGDVTFQLLSRIGIRIQTLSEMPAEVLQQMIGKTVLISGKSKWY
jgi:hypothetical protein